MTLLEHVRAFLDHREAISELWRSLDRHIITKQLKSFAGPLPPQRRLGSNDIVASPDELYEAATAGVLELETVLRAVMEQPGMEGVVLKLAPLKDRGRALEKARDDYSHRAPPSFSWLFDIARASVVCQTEEQIIGVINLLEKAPGVRIIRQKNRFVGPTPGKPSITQNTL
jgi:hypothetical protein